MKPVSILHHILLGITLLPNNLVVKQNSHKLAFIHISETWNITTFFDKSFMFSQIFSVSEMYVNRS